MTVLVLAMALLAPQAAGDPLGAIRRVQGKTAVQSSGALETVMLLAQLAGRNRTLSEFQGQMQSRFILHAGHPAVHETAALIQQGLEYPELALFATLMTQAPYFTLQDSVELRQLAERLPGADKELNADRLHGYSKLVREFYWDTRLGTVLRGAVTSYQAALRHPLPADLPAGARVLISLLAPPERLEFTRRNPPATYVVLGGR
jgi:hypothetical protein